MELMMVILEVVMAFALFFVSEALYRTRMRNIDLTYRILDLEAKLDETLETNNSLTLDAFKSEREAKNWRRMYEMDNGMLDVVKG
jgi:hypothetical protein